MRNAFDGTVRYMSIQIGSGPESDQRVRIGMVPYAHRAQLCDTAVYAHQTGGDPQYVSIEGDVMTGDLEFDSESSNHRMQRGIHGISVPERELGD